MHLRFETHPHIWTCIHTHTHTHTHNEHWNEVMTRKVQESECIKLNKLANCFMYYNIETRDRHTHRCVSKHRFEQDRVWMPRDWCVSPIRYEQGAYCGMRPIWSDSPLPKKNNMAGSEGVEEATGAWQTSDYPESTTDTPAEGLSYF